MFPKLFMAQRYSQVLFNVTFLNRHVQTGLVQNCRYVSTTAAARLILDLPDQMFDAQSLRQAYFSAAKRCHPDVAKNSSDDCGTDAFIEVTSAYELLLGQISQSPFEEVSAISVDEEEAFRKACIEQLGVEAQTVEECKRTPAFRRWLSGRTDAAHYWRNFLMANGGLAPKLKSISGALPIGDHGVTPTVRRKRRR